MKVNVILPSLKVARYFI